MNNFHSNKKNNIQSTVSLKLHNKKCMFHLTSHHICSACSWKLSNNFRISLPVTKQNMQNVRESKNKNKILQLNWNIIYVVMRKQMRIFGKEKKEEKLKKLSVEIQLKYRSWLNGLVIHFDIPSKGAKTKWFVGTLWSHLTESSKLLWF